MDETSPQKAQRPEHKPPQQRDEKSQKPFHFADRLNGAIKKKKSVVCAGLDPRLEQLPEFIKKKARSEHNNPMTAAAEALLEFNKGIIDAVADLVPVVKPQVAFYEQYGHEGMRAFEETLRYAREKGVLTIADIKRGDIGSTAEAYARAFLGKVNLFGDEVFSFDADAVTIAPYLGWDGVKPFVIQAHKYGKGVFVLVKTSNASSGDLQDLEMRDPAGRGAPQANALHPRDSKAVYEIMGHFVDSWGADELGESGYSLLGAVVGATYPEQARKLRKIMPQNIFLVPGYGAQGGTAVDVVPCFNDDGTGAVVNSSRGIMFAWENSDLFTEKDYAEAARDAVVRMKKDLDAVL